MYQEWRRSPDTFDICYERKKPTRILGEEKEKIIVEELRKEKEIIEDYKIPNVTTFNFNALRDEIWRKHKIKISETTIRKKAIQWNFYVPEKKKKFSYTEFEVGGFGILWQHDTSVHQWSPYMEKFYLILTIDDHTRYIVSAVFVEKESSMEHIYSMENAILCFGIPLKYYVDRHSIFTGHDRGGVHVQQQKKKEEFDVQFVMVCERLGIQPVYARSANAKGKVERPFRYLQDRLCRRMAKEQVHDMKHAQEILDEEILYHNHHKIHSTTKQIPADRLQHSLDNKTTLIRKWDSQKYPEQKDIFCLHATRVCDKFQRISYKGQKIKIPNTRMGQKVSLHIRTDKTFEYIRIFANNKNVKNIDLPLQQKKK